MSADLRRAALHRLLRYQLWRSMARLGLSHSLGRKSLPPTSHRADVTLLRDNGRIEIALPADPTHVVFMQRESITAYLYLLSHCPPAVMAMSCACSDGHEASDARFTPSSRTQHTIPVPDRYFILRHGFSAERALAETAGLAWARRSDIIVWRGGANGDGIHPQVAEDAANPRVIQRARLCLLAKAASGIDAKLISGQGAGRRLSGFAPLGIVGAQRPESQWLGDKFAIDIDGWTNAWSNLITRLHFGCCVLKVASADGYRQWWYDRLLPWQHFVPVRADMTDLLEKIDWVRSHDREAQAIAARGQQLARSMTLQAETAIAVQSVEQNWNTN
ncbi:glycosyl transferase family 90 [Devosia sp. A449]